MDLGAVACRWWAVCSVAVVSKAALNNSTLFDYNSFSLFWKPGIQCLCFLHIIFTTWNVSRKAASTENMFTSLPLANTLFSLGVFQSFKAVPGIHQTLVFAWWTDGWGHNIVLQVETVLPRNHFLEVLFFTSPVRIIKLIAILSLFSEGKLFISFLYFNSPDFCFFISISFLLFVFGVVYFSSFLNIWDHLFQVQANIINFSLSFSYLSYRFW